ncbi:biotin-dependent carboxyltransferase family protein [Bacillus sp. FJAT-47783]|uniref:5-oxoprolinase subunit C family protein n=1 Tax=Bacillus sp. FJAT-47783 TaxID=2922712 RepID=UPI001FAC71F2|nr:biotin-dependent carboxyltransferase family protein [Bacillus sp. FJAT-47783]
MMGILVIRSGLLTTIQDLGRFGFQKDGVIVSGVMDSFAHRVANILVGNAETEATIEMTMIGPILKFEEDAQIAICGGEFEVNLDGEEVSFWRPIYVQKGSTLTINQCQKGCRAYLAVAGGYQIPNVMNSQSTYLLAKVGGLNGRAIQKGDTIPLRETSKKSSHQKNFGVSHTLRNYFGGSERDIRVIRGDDFNDFTEQSQNQFFHQSYEITTQSNRMGYRLDGYPLIRKVQKEMVSSAVTFGTIQVPSEGKPIILMVDRQTTGGYPKIAQVAAVDLPTLAQMRPGERITFQEISFKEAQQLFVAREKEIQLLKKQIFFQAEV